MSFYDVIVAIFAVLAWLLTLVGWLLSLVLTLITFLLPLLLVIAAIAIIVIAVRVGAARLAPILEQILERLWSFRSALRTAISRTRHSIVELVADGLWSLGDPVRMLAQGMARAGAPLRGEKPEQRLFPGDPDAETAAVADRERFITELLRRYKRSPPRFEVLQTPPGYETTMIEEPLDERSANAQMVQLLYQTSSPQSLLFSRAADSVICIWRKALKAGAVEETADVEMRLRPTRWWERRRNGYRWVVVIYTDHSDVLKTPLQELRTWIGIGVNFRPAASIGLQRGCARSKDRGTVAGVIRSLSKEIDYSLTCGHVIPNDCDQARIRSLPNNSNPRQRIPDAALLKPHDCTPPGKQLRIKMAPRPIRDSFSVDQSAVTRLGGYSRIVDGYISAPLTEKPLGGIINRFPCCVVRARRTWRWGLIPTPLVLKPFSRKGDSGSWVIIPARDGRRERLWVGMVVAGDRDFPESIVLLASPLVHYFRKNLGRDEWPLAPFTRE